MEGKIGGMPVAVKRTMEDIIKDENAFGLLLLKARLAKDMFLTQMAGILNKKKTVKISDWENGLSFPGDENLLPDIALAYGVDLEELRKVLQISKKAKKEKFLVARRGEVSYSVDKKKKTLNPDTEVFQWSSSGGKKVTTKGAHK